VPVRHGAGKRLTPRPGHTGKSRIQVSVKEILAFFQQGMLVAVIAHGLIGVTLVWDKILLKEPQTKNMPAFIFWLGAISIFGLILIFFGFQMPPLHIAALALAAGALQLITVWAYMEALQAGEASDTLAIMGGFSPVATALIALLLLSRPLGNVSVPAFALMVAGGFVMFLSERLDLRKVLPMILLAAALFGLVNVVQKIAYNGAANFVSAYVFFTIGTFLASMAMLARPGWRRQIFQHSEEASPRSRRMYSINRFLSGLGSFLIYYALSQTSPALVEAITGVRYAVVFVLALLVTKLRPQWLRESFGKRALLAKMAGTALIVAGLAWTGLTGGGSSGNTSARAGHGSFYAESRRTPTATMAAPAQRRPLISSFKIYLASAVSTR
jgi:drug/metabolite transporter (DMT)-like permease